MAFLEQVELWLPAESERVYAILDNLSAHRTTDVLLFMLAHPRWEFVFQPKYAAYLNLIEPWWKVLRSLALKGRRFETWRRSFRPCARDRPTGTPTGTPSSGSPASPQHAANLASPSSLKRLTCRMNPKVPIPLHMKAGRPGPGGMAGSARAGFVERAEAVGGAGRGRGRHPQALEQRLANGPVEPVRERRPGAEQAGESDRVRLHATRT